MSDAMTFRGRLKFRTRKALADVLATLDDDDCWRDSALARDDLACRGATLTVDWDGSAPASTWEGALHVLETLAGAAQSGEVVATHDSGEGPDPILTERIGPHIDDDDDALPTHPDLRYQEAVARGLPDEVREALARGADPNQLGGVRRGDIVDVIDLLLAAGADPNGAPDSEPPLVTLASHGVNAGVRRLLAAGADPSRHQRGRYAALSMAALHGAPDVLDALLVAGAPVGARDEFGDTVLHVALRCSDAAARAAIVARLLVAGADPTQPDAAGATALDLARAAGLTALFAAR